MGFKSFSDELGPGYTACSAKHSSSLGYKYYFTGRPCKKGHISLRLISGRKCSTCSQEMNEFWKINSEENYKKSKSKSDKKYRNKDRIKFLSKKKDEYLRNNSTYIASRDRNREKRKIQNAHWYKLNPEMNRIKARRRRAITKVESDDFDIFVELEAMLACERRREITGYDWHLDHMIPLSKGGAHKYYNFQVIPAWMNQSKWCHMVLTNPFEWVEYLPGAEKCGQRLY